MPISAEKVVEYLQAQIARLEKNAGEEVGGFFFVLAPDSEPITNLFLGDGPSQGAFYKYLADKLGESQKQADQSSGYIGLQGRVR